jgi:hypothetical protein
VYLWETKVRPSWPDKDYLCFTAQTANAKLRLTKTWSPTSISIETSTNWVSWTDYTFGSDITLTNIWDKVYWRNKSETPTRFSTNASNYYVFQSPTSWANIAASWNVMSLLCKNLTDTIQWESCFFYLFYNASFLTESPSLPATTLTPYCYRMMFFYCTNLTTLPKLPATTMQTYCYSQMFQNCSKIKMSTSKTWIYQTEYRIPTIWSGSTASSWNNNMFYSTWWSFTWSPTINTTYYTSNTVV